MAAPSKAPVPIPLPVLMVLSGSAASFGEFCTIPFDTAKVRLQLQNRGELPAGQIRYRGLFHCLSSMVKTEGMIAPWKGVVAGIQRQCAFAPIRIGLYEPVRNFYCGKDFKGTPSVLQKIAAGLTTSAIGITIASPTDVVKVRLQAQGRVPGTPIKYKGAIHAYKTIIAEEGILGLWTGYGPNLLRNCVVNATELVAYDQAKQTFLHTLKMKDDVYTHFASGLSAGLAATLLGSPVDVVKSRVMSAPKGPDGKPEFSGPVQCAVKLLKSEGPLAFYKGFIPNFARIGSWNIITWMTLEQIKKAYQEYAAAK